MIQSFVKKWKEIFQKFVMASRIEKVEVSLSLKGPGILQVLQNCRITVDYSRDLNATPY